MSYDTKDDGPTGPLWKSKYVNDQLCGEQEWREIFSAFMEGRMTWYQADRLRGACDAWCGEYPIAHLCVADVIERGVAERGWEDTPALRELVDDSCQVMARKSECFPNDEIEMVLDEVDEERGAGQGDAEEEDLAP